MAKGQSFQVLDQQSHLSRLSSRTIRYQIIIARPIADALSRDFVQITRSQILINANCQRKRDFLVDLFQNEHSC